MIFRYALLAACITILPLACGGETVRTGPGGSGGSSTATAGHTSSGGNANSGGSGNANSGGSGNANSGGSGNASSGGNGYGGSMVCCNAFPVCGGDERQAEPSECPGQASCHQLSLCCSSIWCVASAGAGGAGGSAAGSRDCAGAACTATQACIAYRTAGGVSFPPDAGTCPTGRHLVGARCEQDFAYKCADLHGACQNQPVTCACAQPPINSPGVCPPGFGSCSEPGPADSEAQLLCQQLVP